MLSRGRAETNAARPKNAQCNRDPPHPATRNAADSQFPGRKRVPNWYGPTGRAKQLQAQVGGIPQGVVSAETCGHPRGVHVSAGRFEALTLRENSPVIEPGRSGMLTGPAGSGPTTAGVRTQEPQSNPIEFSPVPPSMARPNPAGQGMGTLPWPPGGCLACRGTD
jgi:hypothetical protein